MDTASKPRGRRAGFNFTGPLAGLGNSLLARFGVAPAADDPASGRSASQQEVRRPPPLRVPIHAQLWIGARLPFVTFVLILGFFTYLYHIVPIVPWLLAFFGITFAFLVCWPPKHHGVTAKPRGWGDWGMFWSWILAIGSAVLIGQLNYGIIEAWINTAFLPEFHDVKASTNPDSVMDAGILSFSEDTTLQTTMSAGYKFWFYNYCAAPIVGAADPSAAPITYWAVGVGCCASRGDFVCDGAKDTSARAGVPLRPYNLGPEITEHYMNAIQMSAAANDLEVAKEPVFVMWHKDPRKAGMDTWWFCTGLFIFMILVGLCGCCACQSGITHMSVMQQEHT